MGKLIVVLLGFAILAGAAWHYVKGSGPASASSLQSQPARTLENVRGAAGRIEADAQKRLDDLSPRE